MRVKRRHAPLAPLFMNSARLPFPAPAALLGRRAASQDQQISVNALGTATGRAPVTLRRAHLPLPPSRRNRTKRCPRPLPFPLSIFLVMDGLSAWMARRPVPSLCQEADTTPISSSRRSSTPLPSLRPPFTPETSPFLRYPRTPSRTSCSALSITARR